MINVLGILSIVIFYVAILIVGIWAARKKEVGNDSEEEVMLAGRNIGLFVGIFTMTGKYEFSRGSLTDKNLLHWSSARNVGLCKELSSSNSDYMD